VPTTSDIVRAELIETLRLDLVGPDNNHPFARELLPEAPSRWYLTGFLVPTKAPIEQRTDETATDEIDSATESDPTDDTEPPDRGAARKSFLPSSMGLTVLVAPEAKHLEARVTWGDYGYEGPGEEEPSGVPAKESIPEKDEIEGEEVAEPGASFNGRRKPSKGYRRIPREEIMNVVLPEPGSKPANFLIKDSRGLVLVVTCRTVNHAGLGTHRLPSGTKSVSVFLVNNRQPDENHGYRAFAFQTELSLTSKEPFVARPDLRGGENEGFEDEWDEVIADLQYHDVYEYAVGHGVSATSKRQSDGTCFNVMSIWLPIGEVERVAPAPIADVELGMEALAALSDAQAACEKLSPLVQHYRAWIVAQGGKLAGLEAKQQATAAELLRLADHMANRIETGIKLLGDPDVLEAFRISNRAMAQAARRREAIRLQTDSTKVDAPRWRPFQLAFILMTLHGISDPFVLDREMVDLLFFPTGGGKTEAYLGLAAFAMVLRRLRHPGIRSAGMSVLMRYTLRLLTLDQLGRAAALMCALELERERDKEKLGEWPFEIGLWVGSAATPNRMGSRGYQGPGADTTAYRKTRQFKTDSKRYPSPIPLETCPWCGEKFDSNSFRLIPHEIAPVNLTVHCVNHKCEFSGDRSLPILGVDEPIYRRLPAFLIATVDKFAALPWTGETGTLFGLVDRYDTDGFYGPCTLGKGLSLGGNLPPPDLIIQDELHLISGPLGTIAGVYEAAIDALSCRTVNEKRIRPKIIASTATVRRAERQIRALFDRVHVSVFPPPGPDRKDSFFAITEPPSTTPARTYIGITGQGRSLKVVMMRAALAVLSAAQTIYDREGGKRNKQNPVDPYMTLLGYFNSLRELGGSRRIIEDEVRTRLDQYSRRRRLDPAECLFSDRKISYEVVELTSRVPTSGVATAKRRLGLPFWESERVDVALATNMISVGLDILRLGLMVVLGQPKTSAEYIQSTSRVGRKPEQPGLILTLLNIHKPRDRSHYERFETYHSTFYRAVEATSVTPYSPRALDRALAGVLVALCRQGDTIMTPALGAFEILQRRSLLDQFAQTIAERARNHNPKSPQEAQRLRDHVLQLCRSLLDDWHTIADQFRQTNTRMQYQMESSGPQRLLYEPLHPDLLNLPAVRRRFRANRSMRDVEPGVDISLKNLNDWGSKP
jgi:hypothetical protein